MYWPKEGSEIYGIVQVKMVQELTMATYTLRTFVIRNVKLKKVFSTISEEIWFGEIILLIPTEASFRKDNLPVSLYELARSRGTGAFPSCPELRAQVSGGQSAEWWTHNSPLQRRGW